MDSPEALSDHALLQQLANGNHVAFAQLYHRYSKKVFNFAFRILRSDTLSEEVMHEAMIKVWKMRTEVQEIKSFEAYLRTSARNISLNVLRRMELEKRAQSRINSLYPDEDHATEEYILLNDARRILEAAVSRLPQQQQIVFRLCHFQGLKYEEAALQLGISTNTVSNHMKLALKSVRKYMGSATDILAMLVILKLF